MEIKDLLTFLNIEEISEETELDAFKEKFNERFGLKTEIEEEKSKLGKRMGAAETEIKKLFKGIGVEFEEGETKEKSIEEIVQLGSEKLTSSYKDQIKELKDAGAKTGDKRTKELEEQLSKIQTQWDQDKEQLEKVKTEYDEKVQGWETEKKEWKISEQLKTAKGKVSFIDNISEIQKRGYDSLISDTAKFELDDEGQVWPIDPKSGKKFENPDKTGDYLGLDSFLKNKAIEAGIYKQNGGGKPSDTKLPNPEPNQSGQSDNPNKKFVHPSLQHLVK